MPDGCGRAGGLLRAQGVALSPDQEYVYVAAGGNAEFGANGVSIFRRDERSGALRAIGCVSDDGGDGRYGSDGACTNGDALLGATAIAISPDGRQAYVLVLVRLRMVRSRPADRRADAARVLQVVPAR